MPYRFAVDRQDYTALSPGHALITRRGSPAFPVRLTREIFLQCRDYLVGENRPGPYRVYDPCCGAAYLLTVTGFLFSEHVAELIGSDTDLEALEFAEKNLGLLAPGGLEKRLSALQLGLAAEDREPRAEALRSCRMLQSMASRSLPARTFRADALAGSLSADTGPVDIILTDIPHGRTSRWQSATQDAEEGGDGAERLLRSLVQSFGPTRPIVAMASEKRGSLRVPGAIQLRRLRIGKRQVLFYRLEIPNHVSADHVSADHVSADHVSADHVSADHV